jgi:sulfur carrier protein
VTSGATIVLNGERTEVPSGCTIVELLAHLEMADRRVAVAHNRSVVPRSRHAEVTVCEGDRIEILEAVGGG